MSDNPNILLLDNVTVDETHGYDVGLRDVSLSLNEGDFAIVLLQRSFLNVPLADIVNGVLLADAGTATFLGRDWRHTLASRAEMQRGQIGRIFDGQAWISNLDVDENILLPQRHHTSIPNAQLRADAEALAKSFGLSGLPATRPSMTPPHDLRRCACVRAFLGQPTLLLLERPEHNEYPGLMAPLLANIQATRQRGGAALWITNLTEVFDHPELQPTARYRMDGPLLQPFNTP